MDGIAVGKDGINTELDSNLISPATDFNLISFNDVVFMSPALESILTPAGARISNLRVGDSNLKTKIKYLLIKNLCDFV